MNDARREYMKTYQREWRQKRRSAWIEKNGPCRRCGSRERLEVDHVDPKEKKMPPSMIWGLSQGRRDAELRKCQVLCHGCHAKKGAVERAASGSYDAMRKTAPQGMAWCSVGHAAKLEDFGTNKGKRRGISSECSPCRRALRARSVTREEIRSRFGATCS